MFKTTSVWLVCALACAGCDDSKPEASPAQTARTASSKAVKPKPKKASKPLKVSLAWPKKMVRPSSGAPFLYASMGRGGRNHPFNPEKMSFDLVLNSRKGATATIAGQEIAASDKGTIPVKLDLAAIVEADLARDVVLDKKEIFGKIEVPVNVKDGDDNVDAVLKLSRNHLLEAYFAKVHSGPVKLPGEGEPKGNAYIDGRYGNQLTGDSKFSDVRWLITSRFTKHKRKCGPYKSRDGKISEMLDVAGSGQEIGIYDRFTGEKRAHKAAKPRLVCPKGKTSKVASHKKHIDYKGIEAWIDSQVKKLGR